MEPALEATSEHEEVSTAFDAELLAVALNITPLLARIVLTMLTKPSCSTRELRSAINQNYSVYISRLREKLEPLGIKVESRYGIGYVIGPESRVRIRERVKAFAAVPA